MKLSRLAALATVFGMSITTTNAAQAAFVLQISELTLDGTFLNRVLVSDGQGIGFVTDSGLTTTVADTSIGPDGVISYNGGIGGWTVNVTTGISDPVIGPGQLHLDSVSVSGGTGRLSIDLTDTGYTGTVPAYTTTYGGTTTGSSVDISSAFNVFNGEFGGPELFISATHSAGAFSGSDTSPVPAASPYSLSLFSDIVHSDAGQVTSFDAQLTPVPIPAAVWLFGSGLLGMIGIARRKKAA